MTGRRKRHAWRRRPYVVGARTPRGYLFYPACRCGWEGDWPLPYADAWAAFREHEGGSPVTALVGDGAP